MLCLLGVIFVILFVSFFLFFAEGTNSKVANDGVAHAVNEIDSVATTAAGEKKKEEGEGGGGHAKKERSVLQAKLTRLAIQIGYAGKQSKVFLKLMISRV